LAAGLAVFLLLGSCSAWKQTRAKYALSHCKVQVEGAELVLDSARPLLTVPDAQGGSRVHDLTRPSLAMLQDLPAILSGQGVWELKQAQALLQVKVTNGGSKPIRLQDLRLALQVQECEVPAQFLGAVDVPGDTVVTLVLPVRADLDARLLGCAAVAERMRVRAAMQFAFGPEDDEPVPLELEEERPFPRVQAQAMVRQAQKDLLQRLLPH